MSAAYETASPFFLPRAESILHDPQGVEDVEAAMIRLAGHGDRASAMVREHLGTGGKRLRARLALAAASALGVPRAVAVPWATAVELLHNATLIHDDIQDEDRMRRGAPTLWSIYGTAQSINAGDFLLMLPFLALADGPSEAQGALFRGLAEHAVRTVRGQVAEIDLPHVEALDWARYLQAISGKTGALIGLPVFGAAVLAGRSAATAQKWSDAFADLGVLFQLQDDVVDLYGAKGRERPASDLYEGKVSALVVAHIARHPEDREHLMAVLRTPRSLTRDADVAHFAAAFAADGALDDVLARIDRIVTATRSRRDLAEEPSLRAVALEMVRLALTPIGHLVSPGDAA